MISQENLRSEDEEATEQAAIRRSEELRQRPPTEPTVNPINSRRRSLRLYRLFFGTIGYLRTVLWCFSMLVVSAGECAPEVYMRIWIDVDPNNNSYFIGYAAIASCTCVLFALVFASLCNHLTPRAALQLHSQLTSTVVGGTIAFLCAIDKGVLVNRFSQDMSLVVRNLPLAFMRTIYSQSRSRQYTSFLSYSLIISFLVFWTAVIQTGIVASGASYMVIAIPFIIIAFYLIQGFYLRTSRQMRSLDLEAKSPLYTHFEETAAGLLCIRGFGWQAENLKRGFDLLDDSQKAFYYMITIQQWLGLVVGLLIASLGSILVAFALFLSESTSDTAIGLAFLNLILFGQTLEMLIGAWTNLETSVGALARLEEFMKETPQEDAQKLATLPRNWPSMGNIELTDMSAQYRYVPAYKLLRTSITDNQQQR